VENGMKYDLEARLATTEAAKVLSVSTSFLNKTRLFGNGPKFEKRGRLVRYRYGTLLDYMVGQTRRSTSDNGDLDTFIQKRVEASRAWAAR
jgi:hypothetical protein